MQILTASDFCHLFLPKIVNKWGSVTSVESSENFLFGFANYESELGFVTPTGLPG